MTNEDSLADLSPALNTDSKFATPTEPARRASVLWVVFALIAAMVFTIVLLALWQRMDALQAEAARRLSNAEQAATVARANSESIAAQLRNAEARLAAAEARIADSAAQRAALDKLMSDATSRESLRISGDFEQLLTLAEQEAQLTINPAPLLMALRVLEGRAELAPTLARDKLKAAIAKDSDSLRQADLPDRAALLTKSDELARLLDELPLAATVIAATAPKNRIPISPDKSPKNTDTPSISPSISNNNKGEITYSVPSIQYIDDGWLWLKALAAPLTDWFKLRRIDTPDALLTTTEQQFWLRENMKLQAQSARLSLLARQSESYQRSLEKVQQALAQFADAKQPKVQQAQAILAQLRNARLNALLPVARETRAVLTQLANSPLSYSANSARELQKR
jgi:uroporphyrin-III C-methyltransferase